MSASCEGSAEPESWPLTQAWCPLTLVSGFHRRGELFEHFEHLAFLSAVLFILASCTISRGYEYLGFYTPVNICVESDFHFNNESFSPGGICSHEAQ